MWLTKNILVACDFSASSRKACEAGVELAETFRVPLTFMHVVPIATAIYPEVSYMAALDCTKVIEEPSLSALGFEAKRFEDRGVELSTLLKVGEPWEEIIDAARRLDAGLIVMGTHGRRRLPRAILGSVAEKVARLSPVPVLTIGVGDNQADETVAGPAQ